MRHIAHEVLRTLIPGYSKHPNLGGAQILLQGASISMEMEYLDEVPYQPLPLEDGDQVIPYIEETPRFVAFPALDGAGRRYYGVNYQFRGTFFGPITGFSEFFKLFQQQNSR